jgi:hypothetical protein
MRKADLAVIVCALLVIGAFGYFEGREARPIVQPASGAAQRADFGVRLGYKDWSLEVPEKEPVFNRYLEDATKVTWPAPAPKFRGEMVCTEITATSARSWPSRRDGMCYVSDAMPWPK